MAVARRHSSFISGHFGHDDGTNIYVTPTCRLSTRDIDVLMLAPKKKKPQATGRRRSAPPSLNYSCIRKRLDFDLIITETISSEARTAHIGVKRKLNETPCRDVDELAVALPEGNSSSKIFELEVENVCNKLVATPKFKKWNLENVSEDRVEIEETPISDLDCYGGSSKAKEEDECSALITPVVPHSYRLGNPGIKPDIVFTEESAEEENFTKILNKPLRSLKDGQKNKVLGSKSARNLSLVWQ